MHVDGLNLPGEKFKHDYAGYQVFASLSTGGYVPTHTPSETSRETRETPINIQ